MLEIEKLSKTFPGTKALSEVSLRAARGEVHALLGGNGSGKSTLIKILAGVHRADPGGTIRVGSKLAAAASITPAWARAAGVRFVHQDLGLFDDLSVAENMFVSSPHPRRRGRIDWRAVERDATRTLERLEFGLDASGSLGRLRPADRTLVAIARALHDDGDRPALLVLDEPSAPLPAAEVEHLLSAVRRVAAGAVTVVYVSHRLDEVLAIADAATVLRDGRVVARRRVAGLAEEVLVTDIAGQTRSPAPDDDSPRTGTDEPVLSVRGLAGGPVQHVNLDLYRGEILGIGGLVGSGRSTLLELLFGAKPRSGGTVALAGRPCRPCSPRQGMDAGLAYVPESRVRDGMFGELGLPENLSAADHRRFSRFGVLRPQKERAAARADVETMHIRAPSLGVAMSHLSGGNQQKAVVGRWLRRDAAVLLLDEPTQGVDVTARQEIHRLVRRAVQRGGAAILVSSDSAELAQLAHRLLILADGRVVAERSGDITANWITEQVFRTREDQAWARS